MFDAVERMTYYDAFLTGQSTCFQPMCSDVLVPYGPNRIHLRVSFNDSIKSNIIWRGFTLDNWLNVCDQADVCGGFRNSLLVAVTATAVSTVLGTMIAIALVRYRFKFTQRDQLAAVFAAGNPRGRHGRRARGSVS